ncbi:MAG TPA: ANTAR domain-containing protein [Actinomycetospora sp.]|uniref:ANTAR domain-containing protein n=1 Tax=Actinomycetospora sp. TaxID=1872135 RepID=UPI002F42A512
MFGLRRSEHALQIDREVARAQDLLIELFGLSADEATAALRNESMDTGVSLHAVALAVVANWATQAPVLRRAPQPQ